VQACGHSGEPNKTPPILARTVRIPAVLLGLPHQPEPGRSGCKNWLAMTTL